jgi:hypothetical protein
MSSIGKFHKPFLDSFICSIKASENNFHLLWPEYDEAMNKPGKDRVIIGQGNVKFACRYMSPLLPIAERANMLFHSKIIHSSAYAYFGSHNLSMSAWGKLVHGNSAIHISNFELGVLSVNLEGGSLSQRVPFIIQSPPPGIKCPWNSDEFYNKVFASFAHLKDTDVARIKISDGQRKSFAEFIANDGPSSVGIFLDDKSMPLVSKFVAENLSARMSLFRLNIRGLRDSDDYTRHIVSFFEASEFPAFLLLNSERQVTEWLVGSQISERFRMKLDPKSSFQSSVGGTGSSVKRLILLEVDGIVAESKDSTNLSPLFQKFLVRLDPLVKIALVTNQDKLGLRYRMMSESSGNPSN